MHRVMVHNVMGGEIRGSRDGGKTWEVFGHVTKTVEGKIWTPTIGDKVYAFFFLRGPANVFATAVNAVHLRFSDPVGYQLPLDPTLPLVPPHGLSLMPLEFAKGSETDPGVEHTILTDISGGTQIFGREWGPKIGSSVFMGDGKNFTTIPYDVGPDSRDPARAYILIVTYKGETRIEYMSFENKIDGKVILKREGEEPVQIAKVIKAVEGIGRFLGSEVLQRPGQIRANHAGVIDVGTTDIKTDPNVPNYPMEDPRFNELRGGFQIIPSHHWHDDSLHEGNGSGMVDMVVGPIIDPPTLVRYDFGVDGTYPMFRHGLRGGTGLTYFKFKGDANNWVELNDAVAQGKFKRPDGTVINHLRGFIKDALLDVTDIKLVNDSF